MKNNILNSYYVVKLFNIIVTTPLLNKIISQKYQAKYAAWLLLYNCGDMLGYLLNKIGYWNKDEIEKAKDAYIQTKLKYHEAKTTEDYINLCDFFMIDCMNLLTNFISVSDREKTKK